MVETRAIANFKLTALDDRTFQGYIYGSTWNGWETPLFEYDVAVSILRASEGNGYRWTFDEAQDAFAVRHIDDPQDYMPEVFQAVEMTVDGHARTVYPIGSHSWVWERQS